MLTWIVNKVSRTILKSGFVVLAFLPTGGFVHRCDLARDAGRLQTFTFETLLFFALFSLVSIRERRFLWMSRPSATLALALAGDAGVGVLISAFGLGELRPLPADQMAAIVGYALLCALVNDVVKVGLFRRGGRPAPDARTRDVPRSGP